MKKSYLVLFIILFLVGCQPNDVKPDPEINYSGKSTLSIGNDGGALDISFNTNVDWTASASASWVSLSPASGQAGDSKVKATITPNTDYEDKSAVITINAGGQKIEIKVDQPANKGFVLPEAKFSIGSNGGELKIPVKANTEYSCTVAEGCKDWITVKQTKSLQDYQIVVSVAKNESLDARTGSIEVSCSGKTETVTISQSQVDEMIVGRTDFEIGSNGGEIRVPISANIEYNAEVQGDASKWLTITKVQTKGLEEYFMVLNIAENKDYDGRVGQVKVTGAGKESVVTITQSQMDELIVGETSYTIGKEGGEVKIPFQANCKYETMILGDASSWMSIVPNTKGLNDYTLTVKVKENSSYDNRIGQVKISGAGKESVVSISQNQTAGLEIDEIFEISYESQDFNITFKSNVDVTCEIDKSAQSWLSVVQTKGLVDGSIALHAEENDSDTERVAKVKVMAEGIEKEVSVKQLGNPELVIIKFEDKYARSACLRNFDKNGDGEISMKEAAAVTSISSNFLNKDEREGIKRFKEFKYFTGINKIPSSCFEECRISEIILPDGVTNIGNSAFHECYKLTSITLPESLTTISDYAFSGCGSLTSIMLPKSLTTIGSYAFHDCYNLKSLMLPENLITIGDWAFYYCTNLMTITIPKGVVSIGDAAFRDCKSLTNITISEGVVYIGSGTFMDCSSLTTITLPKSVSYIGDYAFAGCSSLASITIPEGVTDIIGVFENCSSLTSITLPESVTNIGARTFYGCSSLTSINIPESVSYIGDYAFYGCSSLKRITIPESVTSIGEYTFRGCSSLTSINIPESVSYIGDYAFYGCSSLASSITIPAGVTDIIGVFYECSSLTSITLPEGVINIGMAFAGCSSLTSITIPEGVTSIGGSAFYGCSSLASIKIPEGVTSIGGSAFCGCSSLASIKIPEGVTSIGANAFWGCSGLTSITIPEGVTSIGECAFAYCSSLKSFYCKPITPPFLRGYIFSNYVLIYVPRCSVNEYNSVYKYNNQYEHKYWHYAYDYKKEYSLGIVGYEF